MHITLLQAKHNTKDHDAMKYAWKNINAWNNPTEVNQLRYNFCTK